VITILHHKDTAVLQNNTTLREAIVVKAVAGIALTVMIRKQTAKIKIS